MATFYTSGITPKTFKVQNVETKKSCGINEYRHKDELQYLRIQTRRKFRVLMSEDIRKVAILIYPVKQKS